MRFAIAFFLLCGVAFGQVDYPIVYVRAPYKASAPLFPEVKDPVLCEAGTDLVLREPDGTERVLVQGGTGAVMDPYPTFDGQWVLYAYIYDAAARSNRFSGKPYRGSDIFKVNVATGQVVQLTHGEFTPSTVVPWYDNPFGDPSINPSKFVKNAMMAGVFNLGPCPLPDGRFMFTSSRNGWKPTKSFTWPAMQLFVADIEDGKNCEQVDFRSFGSALHPHVLSDGRVMFSSYETQGKRDIRVWSLWEILPDGRDWMSLLYQNQVNAFHFHAELNNGHLACIDYYNGNNWGFGTLLGFPLALPPGETGFDNPVDKDNPPLPISVGTDTEWMAWYPFKRYGLYSLTPWSLPQDKAAGVSLTTGLRVGKVTQPAGAPDGCLVTYSPGAVNALNRPVSETPKAGIYLIPNNAVTNTPEDLVKIVDKPEYNEQQARPLVPYQDIYGVPEPVMKEWLPDTVHPMLPKGTPFGLVGSSTVYLRETNTPPTPGDTVEYTGDDVYYIRYLAQMPNLAIDEGPDEGQGFNNGKANERVWILGDVPVRNAGHTDQMGNPDTSHLARLPANVSWMQQLLNEDKEVLTNSWTWKQVRPGETITKCGGCHYHSQPGLPFETTFASTPSYVVHDLASNTPKMVDWTDVSPIFDEHCVSCHSGAEPAGGLVLDSTVADNEELVDRFAAIKSELYMRVKGTSSGDQMPLGGPALSSEELQTIAAWIDTGATVGVKSEQWTTKPTLHVEHPARKVTEPVTELLVGAFSYGGVTVEVDAPVGVSLISEDDGVYRYALAEPMESGDITFTATDVHGNTQKIVRTFALADEPAPVDPCDDIQAENDQLTQENAQLQSEVDSLRAKIDAARQHVDAAQEALE